jgi:hypothetical protein
MRPGLVGYFDIGATFGLGDEAFKQTMRADPPDIGLVGIQFPLGQGTVLDLRKDAGDLVPRWRAEARDQSRRPEIETGWTSGLGIAKETFARRLGELIERSEIALCELRIHAVGSVFAELHFESGIPLEYVDGLLTCFEYAAYRPWIAMDLLDAATSRANSALVRDATPLRELSKRSPPEVTKDAKGYEECPLFTGFTQVLACIDPSDERALQELTDGTGMDSLEFEYHGTLYYRWDRCVLAPKQLQGWDEEGGEGETPAEQLMRMEACIRVAHVFQGTCEAFIRLFDSEIHAQVGGYVARRRAGRRPEDLNRLRTLALAVVNLTDFAKVTPTDEDQHYFRRYDKNADVTGKHQAIQQATEVLYNVQVAERQNDETKRQWTLSIFVGLLTSLTLISVTTDAYNFIREDRSLLDEPYRLVLLFVELVIIIGIVFGVIVLLRGRRRVLGD